MPSLLDLTLNSHTFLKEPTVGPYPRGVAWVPTHTHKDWLVVTEGSTGGLRIINVGTKKVVGAISDVLTKPSQKRKSLDAGLGGVVVSRDGSRIYYQDLSHASIVELRLSVSSASSDEDDDLANLQFERIVGSDYSLGLAEDLILYQQETRILVTDYSQTVRTYSLVTDEPVYAFAGKYKRGAASGVFDDPRGITELPNGNVAVVDCVNKRVQFFDKNGIFHHQLGGGVTDLFNVPMNIVSDKDGNMLVYDAGINTMKVFDKDERNKRTLVKPIPDRDDREFPERKHLAWNEDGRLAVSMPDAHTIVILQAEGAAAEEAQA